MRLIATPFIVAATTVSAFAADGGFPPFETRTFAGQVFWLAVTFGLLYIMMSKVAVPRIGSILEERQSTIDSALSAAANAQKTAESEAQALEQALSKAKSNAQAIASEARAKSAKEIDAKRHAVETDLNAKMVAAEASIAETKAKAMANVEDIAKDAASALVERLTGKAPTAAAAAKAFSAISGK